MPETYSGLKVNLYLTQDVSDELRSEAKRQRRSASYLIRKAWILSRAKLDKLGELQAAAEARVLR